MELGPRRVLGGADERGDDEVVRQLAREAGVHAGIDEGLHHREEVGRARAGERGGHGDELLVVDLTLLPERAERGPRQIALGRGAGRRRGPHGDALPNLRRGVRHGSHDGGMREAGREAAERGAGDDREDHLLWPQRGCQLGHDATEHLWLHRQHDDLRVRESVGVARDDPDGVPRRERLAPIAARMAGDEPLRRDRAVGEKAGDHRLGHHPGADERDSHRATWTHPTSFSSPTRSRAAAISSASPPPRWSSSIAIRPS